MNLASDPTIQRKISQMAARVRWKDTEFQRQGIDQTRLVFEQNEGDQNADAAFHFLVLGDSGTGRHRFHSPPRRIAKRLLSHKKDAAFLLHTGDVVYLVGAADQYRDNFLKPYREWLSRGENWSTLNHQGLVFNQPFLPVPGNHDYYDLSLPVAVLAGLTLPLRRHLQWFHDIDAGWRGSRQGEAFAQAFLDVTHSKSAADLSKHLAAQYSAIWDEQRCLHYRPGAFTRLPNRYYRFRHAGVDVFALDSNTLITIDQSSDSRQLREELKSLGQRQTSLYKDLAASALDEGGRDDLLDELETLQEQCFDLQRRIKHGERVDHEQLNWLRDALIESHRDPSVRGRILTMHHPAYVTEKTKWRQADTQAIRQQLRGVFNAVSNTMSQGDHSVRPVDLVLSGHAHCMEVLRTHDTGHADRHIDWVICGGSGYGLRRQRQEGPELMETAPDGTTRLVARSELYIGRDWSGGSGGDAYSGLRIDIEAGRPLRIRLTPLVSCRDGKTWLDADPEPITLKG